MDTTTDSGSFLLTPLYKGFIELASCILTTSLLSKPLAQSVNETEILKVNIVVSRAMQDNY